MDAPERVNDLPYLGLAVITKDEEENLPRLLDSVEGHVDCVVVCDTGSTDDTIEVAIKRGCRVVQFKWCEDFSAARQASYDAFPDWVEWTIWADADDTITGAEKLRTIAANCPPTVAGVIFPYAYATDPAGNEICRLERERLVRRGIGERWDLPIHEVLQVPGQLVRSDEVTWVHHKQGTDDPERNLRILQADLAKSGDEPNPRTLVYLGTELLALGKPDEAEPHLRRYLEIGTWDEERCQAAHKLSIALRTREDPDLEESERWAHEAIYQRPDWADGYLDLAEIALRREQHERALRFAERAKACGTPETLLIINPLDYSYQPDLMRAAALSKLGRAEEALEITHALLARTPYREDLRVQGAQIGHEVKIRETERHVLSLRELLVRHDENLAADTLMRECVPYYARNRPAISVARADSREMVLHATDPELYRAYYGGGDHEARFEEHGIDVEKAHEGFSRVAFLRAGLKEQAAA